ncbi:unnamed protein product [Symbiodinium natans]|uniref:Uncharacterized protein n=1 Tax=Symbiodinium natans TaxID=878477 RepID=A0A812GD07_9DINO|nr:unnamed protein product [Symbiodinium natans]
MPPKLRTAELARLQEENAELRRRVEAGAPEELWETWLQRAAEEVHTEGSWLERWSKQRLLMLKGQIMQEEWGIRSASQVLEKQQAALRAVQRLPTTPAAVKAVEDAVAEGNDFVAARPDAVARAHRSSAARKVLCKSIAALLQDAVSAHGRVCTRGPFTEKTKLVQADLRALALRAAALFPEQAWSHAEAALPDADHLAAKLKDLEARLHSRAARQAVRAAFVHLRLQSAVWNLEMHLLKAEDAGNRGVPDFSAGRMR